MNTPWGHLATLNPLDRDLAFEILSADKHSLLEGLVVENTFDQIVQPLTEGAKPSLVQLDVETAIARHFDHWFAFVWVRSKTVGLGRYLQALEKVANVYLVSLQGGTFVAQAIRSGSRTGPAIPLQGLLAEITKRHPIFPRVDASVRNAVRQRAAFWGFLNEVYPGMKLWERVVLPRLFMNCGIQAFGFHGVWNLDRICLFHPSPHDNGDLWMLEVKHKYPMKGAQIQFGINDGEVQMMRLAAECGITTMHGIIVKPLWDKEFGAMYLHNDMAKRARAAVIGSVLDLQMITDIERRKSSKSAPHTTLTGRKDISYKKIYATEFRFLGSYAEGPERLSKRLRDLLSGEPINSVTDHTLRGLSATPIMSP